jgi:hypothetical protein
MAPLLFLLFFAANYQPSTSSFRRDPGPPTVWRTKERADVAVLPLLAAVFVKSSKHFGNGTIIVNGSSTSLQEDVLPRKSIIRILRCQFNKYTFTICQKPLLLHDEWFVRANKRDTARPLVRS